MKANIEIECGTAGDLIAILEEVISTIRIRSRQDLNYDFETGTHFHRSYYGECDVTIVNNQEVES